MKTLNHPTTIASLTALVTLGLIAAIFVISPTAPARVSTKTPLNASQSSPLMAPSGTMSLQQLGAIITRLDTKAESPRTGFWRFTIDGAAVITVGDMEHDRLRILVGIRDAKDLSQQELAQIAKSNFDTALDARYAISQDVLWAIYVHPIKSLVATQFVSAIGQTVNLAKSYGDGNSSGGILFDGGDKKDAARHRRIELLLERANL